MTTDLDIYNNARAAMYAEVDEIVRDTDDGPGWSNVLDVDRCPTRALPWLAQFVGVTLDPADDDTAMRAKIRAEGGFRRGTLTSLKAAAQRLLTGTQTVIVLERDTSAYHFTVITYTSETPDADAVEAALTAQKPAGLVMDYMTVDGQIWAQLIANYATWQGVIDAYATWQDVIDDTPS